MTMTHLNQNPNHGRLLAPPQPSEISSYLSRGPMTVTAGAATAVPNLRPNRLCGVWRQPRRIPRNRIPPKVPRRPIPPKVPRRPHLTAVATIDSFRPRAPISPRRYRGGNPPILTSGRRIGNETMTNVHDGEDDAPETSSHATTESNVEGGTDEPSESMADDGTSSLADEGELNIMLQAHVEEVSLRILQVVNLVSETLQNGLWPSPNRSLEQSENDDKTDPPQTKESRYMMHKEHMCIVSASLCQFARDVLIPSFTADSRPPLSKETETRIVLGTLLALREVLTQNAKNMFGPKMFITGQESNFGWTESEIELYGECSDEFARQAAVFSARVLATAVCVAALEALPSEMSEPLIADFLRYTTQYDFGDEQFRQYLPHIDERVRPVLTTDQPLDEGDQKAWRVSFNLHREIHALVMEHRRQHVRTDSFEETANLDTARQLFEVNAAHITILEQQRR